MPPETRDRPRDQLDERLTLWRGRATAVTNATDPETIGDVACGPCPSCDGPLHVTSTSPLTLTCSHCHTVEHRG